MVMMRYSIWYSISVSLGDHMVLAAYDSKASVCNLPTPSGFVRFSMLYLWDWSFVMLSPLAYLWKRPRCNLAEIGYDRNPKGPESRGASNVSYSPSNDPATSTLKVSL